MSIASELGGADEQADIVEKKKLGAAAISMLADSG
jgi:hypothetical protein